MSRAASPRTIACMNGCACPAPAPCARTRRSTLLRDRLLQVDRRALPADAQVDHLDEDREAHGEVDVALRDVLLEAFADQRDADQQQEAERQHLRSEEHTSELQSQSNLVCRLLL